MFGFTLGTWFKIGFAVVIAIVLYTAYYQVQNWCNDACQEQKGLYEASQKAYAEAVMKAAAKIGLLEAGNAALSKKYEAALREKDAQAAKAAAAIRARIKANEELRNMRVSADAIRVFNDAILQGNTAEPDGEGSAKPKPGNDDAGKATKGNFDNHSGGSLADIALQVAENSAAHWECVRKVETWIGFWKDYVTNVKAVESP